ncbi:MAG: nucleotidyltransferase domain-containing protein [Firmicutes bacterium]|nr:nucleotidyltransferase domain-containing protein [Bacillota bacterium]
MIVADKEIQQAINRIMGKLLSEYGPQKVILFGSYAYGTPEQDSDLDLLIVKETTERPIDRWVTVQRILTGTHRSLPVDTLVLTPQEIESRIAVGDQFIKEILQKGATLYAAQ